MEWLSNWMYRQGHTLAAGEGAGTNYQVSLTVHYDADTSNGGDVYCDGKCKTDFSDIRFTASDGSTELSHWLQTKTDEDNAVFWVKVAANLDSNQNIYVYYGNASAVSGSSQANTFIDVIGGVVGAWLFHEGAGEPQDSSGNNNHGAITGASWVSTGKYGNALNFDGNDYVTVADDNDLDLTTGITMMAWIKRSAIDAYQRFISKTATAYAFLFWNDNRLVFDGKLGGVAKTNFSTGTVTSITEFKHVALTYKADGHYAFYINAADAAHGVSSQVGNVGTNASPLFLGARDADGQYLTGIMSDVLLFNVDLTSTQISNIYANYADPNLFTGSVLVRKWAVTTLPTHGAWFTEESGFGSEQYYYYTEPLKPTRQETKTADPQKVDWSLQAVLSEALGHDVNRVLAEARRIGTLKQVKENN